MSKKLFIILLVFFSCFNIVSAADLLTSDFSDYGDDTDGDELFDYLIIEFSINVPEAGEYDIYGELKDSSGNYMLSAGDDEFNLNAGENTIQIIFNGIEIYRNGVDGPYELSDLYIEGKDIYFEEQHYDLYNTSSYSYEEFQRPGATFTGVFSDYGTDADEDRFYDYLTVEVEVNVAKAGTYGVEGYLRIESEISDFGLNPQSEIYLEEGIHTFQLNFNGVGIYLSGVDGPYQPIDLELYDVEQDVILDEYEYTSSVYSYTEFQRPYAKFTGNFLDYGYDKDGDGLYDYLIVEAEVDITKAGNYEIWGRLEDSLDNAVYSKYFRLYLNTGVYTIPLNFSGMPIYSNQVNGHYNLARLSLYDSDDDIELEELHDVYSTSYYDYTDFQRPGLEVIGSFADYGVDTNENGLFDYLTIKVPINVIKAGYYRINAYLDDVDSTYKKSYLDLDDEFIYLNFTGISIYNGGQNGPYFLKYFEIEFEDVEIYNMKEGYYTGFYDYTDFEHDVETVNCVIPTNRMVITEDTTFCLGKHTLEDGIIVGADNIILDCDSSTIQGLSDDAALSIQNRENVTIKNCILENNEYGFWIKESKNVILINNSIFNSSRENLRIVSYSKENYNHKIYPNNYINGKPVYYYFEENDVTLEDKDVGYLGIFYSKNINVINNSFINSDGIKLAYSNHSNILKNKLINTSEDSIIVIGSNFNHFEDNFISGGWWGIMLHLSDNNSIINNNIEYNDVGIIITDSDYNLLRFNNINNNSEGIGRLEEQNNIIEYNNLYDNNINLINGDEHNKSAQNNYWGTTDINEIQSKIYDGNDDLADDEVIGVIDFCPYLDGVYPDGIQVDCNTAPVIDYYSPSVDTPKIPENGQQSFVIHVSDADEDILEVRWFVDDKLVDIDSGSIGKNSTYTFVANGIGNYNITAVVSDSEFDVSHSWLLTVSDIPIVVTFDGDTTDFSGIEDISNVKNIILERTSYGRIDFGEEVINLNDTVDLDNFIVIEQGVVALDSRYLNAFEGKSAQVSIYDVKLTDRELKIYYNDRFTTNPEEIIQLCPEDVCSDIVYDADTSILTFRASHFSSFKAGTNSPPIITSTPITIARIGIGYKYSVDAEDADSDSLTYELTIKPNGMSIDSNGLITWIPATEGSYDVVVRVTDSYDTTTQSFTIIVSSSKLTIKEVKVIIDGKKDTVNNGEKISKNAKPGSDIEFKVVVENIFEEEMEIDDIDVIVTIKDIDDDNDLDKEEEINSIDEENDKTVSLDFEIPLEVDEGVYDVFIEVIGKDENNDKHREEWTLELGVDKERHKIIINDIDLIPENIKCSRSVSLEVEIINIGSSDEKDVSIEVKNPDLELNLRETDIELEEGIEDNKYKFSTSINTNTDVKQGTYPILINVYRDSEFEVTDSIELIVENCEVTKTVKEPVRATTTHETENPVATKNPKLTTTTTFKDTNGYMILLILGNVILLGMVIYVIGAMIILVSRKR